MTVQCDSIKYIGVMYEVYRVFFNLPGKTLLRDWALQGERKRPLKNFDRGCSFRDITLLIFTFSAEKMSNKTKNVHSESLEQYLYKNLCNLALWEPFSISFVLRPFFNQIFQSCNVFSSINSLGVCLILLAQIFQKLWYLSKILLGI